MEHIEIVPIDGGTMIAEWDVPIRLSDGTVLRADVFRPDDDQPHPVLMTHGPYGKWLSFAQGFPGMWNVLEQRHPEALAGSSNRYQVWETPDPEKWVPHGYACVRVDSRGSGRSPGRVDIFSEVETRDFAECIEWAGTQPWSSGRVGLSGVSYYAMNQWQVAALAPPHLAAICPWEGASDYYREFIRHGGILSTFYRDWYDATVIRTQHGLGQSGEVSAINGELVSGPETLTPAQLEANRPSHLTDLHEHRLVDDYHRARSPRLEDITVPVLSAANWAHHLHTRGNFEGYLRAGSSEKWLEVHGLEHWVEYYTPYGVELQRQFFDYYLHGKDNGWPERAPVVLNVRHVDGSFSSRDEEAWPIPRTRWTRLSLDAGGSSLVPDGTAEPGVVEVTRDRPATFVLAAQDTAIELTGPLSARLSVSAQAEDVDVFLTLRVIDPSGVDVALRSALDPAGVITAGWLRASHRSLDPDRSTPERPYHPHDREVPLEPGEITELEVEIWPTSIVIPPGYRLALTVTATDFAFPGDGPWPHLYGIPMRGNGIFLHDDPRDRPEGAGSFRVHTGGEHASSLLVPIVPDEDGARSEVRFH
ncbi:CocE/NonD family hydrolase [Microbacterium sp. ARD31]|uniref:CocE/NonD family hydrolase n=1 Tax=Microbacterium sp. ARD31 TaxID=2962576 RepID=UPI002880D913|nr:CocE/NonD family hydrolase [Microbacterium sp. ARD31]MDT0183946.1 CocE/NonD family hydrolase [Microbacterium sp. ARD31]